MGMSVQPSAQPPKRDHWVPKDMAPTVQWTNKTGLSMIHAAVSRPTEFNAQKEGLNDRATNTADKLGRTISYMSYPGNLVTRHSVEAY